MHCCRGQRRSSIPRKRSPMVFNEEDLFRIVISLIISQSKSLMGIEYVFGTKVEHFKCVLCNKSFHVNLVVGHVVGNSHRLKYCAKFFPTLSDYLERTRKMKGDAFISGKLDIIASIIKQLNSRNYPHVYVHEFYEHNQQYVHEKVLNAPHVDRTTKLNLENILLNAATKESFEIESSSGALVDILHSEDAKKSEPKVHIKAETRNEQISSDNATRALPDIENASNSPPLTNVDESIVQKVFELYRAKQWTKRVESLRPAKSSQPNEPCINSNESERNSNKPHSTAPQQPVVGIVGSFPFVAPHFLNFQQPFTTNGLFGYQIYPVTSKHCQPLPTCFTTDIFDTVTNSWKRFGYVYDTATNYFMPYDVFDILPTKQQN